MKLKQLVIGVVLGSAMSGAAAAETVVIGQPNWAYAKVLTEVMKVVIEDNFGVEVEFAPGKHPVFFKAMSQGRGEVDVHPDIWMPNQTSFVQQYVEGEGTVVLTGPKFDAKSGFCTTEKAHKEFGLNSIYDLTKPEIINLTDEDGDGMGEFWIGAPGWTATANNKVRARDFGFSDLYDLTESEENLILSKIEAYSKQDKTVIWACYAPHHIFAMVDVHILEEPEHDATKWKLIHPSDDPDWFEKSVASTSWPPIASHMAYSKRLSTEAPLVARLLDRMELDTQTINEWAFEFSVNNREPEEIASSWVSENSGRISGWLSN